MRAGCPRSESSRRLYLRVVAVAAVERTTSSKHMLTSDLALSWQRGNKIAPRYIDAANANHLRTAEDLIFIFSQHQDKSRAELERALDKYVGVGTDYRILRGLIKLLDDRCEFETVSAKDPAELRAALFFKAAAHHPVSETTREEVIAAVAGELKCSAAEVMSGLYADLPANQRLTRFDELSARELLDRYNVAQAQALLYRCTELRLWLDNKEPEVSRRLFLEIRRRGLIHTISGHPATGYEIRLSGPVSLFHRSQKYGIQMAVFLPALLLYPGWRMKAEITAKNGPAFFELSSDQHKLHSHYLSEELPDENPALKKIMESWDATGSEWRLRADHEVIDLGETAFVPDLAFVHPNGKKVYLELLGYWTPRYLNDRLQDFTRGGFGDYLLAVSEEQRCSRDAPAQLPPNVLLIKKTLTARDLNRALERLSETDRELTEQREITEQTETELNTL